MIIKFLILALLASLSLQSDSSSDNWNNNYATLSYISTSSIIGVDLSDITPTINNALIPGGDASFYLESDGCLGYLGPIGPQGPLGLLGPIGGNDTFDISDWMKALGDWSEWAQQWIGEGGPLSENGPLGMNGPASPQQYYGEANPGQQLFESNDFAVQLRGFGIWSALGPLGALGPFGALGPLGPVGAHGYKPDSDGNYLNSDGTVERTYTVQFNSTSSVNYELFENYQRHFAECMQNQDTSFMIDASQSETSDIDYFPIHSNYNQLVSILLVPEYDLDQWALGVYNTAGTLVAASEVSDYVEYIQMQMTAGSDMVVAVKCIGSGQFLTKPYRLFVTGSTEQLGSYNIQGPHVLPLYTMPKNLGGSFAEHVSNPNSCTNQSDSSSSSGL